MFKNCFLSYFTVFSLALIFLSGCKPTNNLAGSAQQVSTDKFRCLASQNQCSITNQLGTFDITFSVDPVLTEMPFHIMVDYQGEAEGLKLTAYLEGKDMFMGKVPVMFKPNADNSKRFIAETMLASCSEDIMTWKLNVTVESALQASITPMTFIIEFDSKRL